MKRERGGREGGGEGEREGGREGEREGERGRGGEPSLGHLQGPSSVP